MTKGNTKAQLAGGATAKWWRDLQPDPERNHKGDRAALARLRRMGSVPEALTDPAVMDLISKVADATEWRPSPDKTWITAAAVAAVTLAHLRKSGRQPMAEVLGHKAERDAPPRYSGLRFTRLIRADSDTERLTQLGRAARRLRADDAAVNIERLATDLYRLWSEDPGHADKMRRDWTFQYHQMTAAAPGADDTAELTKEVSQ